jgi:hypothetical protein
MSAKTEKLNAAVPGEKLAAAALAHGRIRHYARELAKAHYAKPAPAEAKK